MRMMITRNLFLIFLLSTVTASAQEAAPAAEQAAPAAQEVAAPQVPVVLPSVAAPASAPKPSKSKEQIMDDLLADGNPLRTRQEEEFDVNGNRRLDPNEIRAMCKKMYEDTARGPVANTSDIFWAFDTNQDGSIDRSEASALSRYAL